jgi:hypothetical protein
MNLGAIAAADQDGDGFITATDKPFIKSTPNFDHVDDDLRTRRTRSQR